jgi:hypothetical protein
MRHVGGQGPAARGGSGLSEYQYYEFQAVDRRLTEKEMAELRTVSTRGRITPTSFVNEYSWGDFKGDEDAWMEKYFDAFLYLANWGTHVLKLRLPERLLDAQTAQQYCTGEHAWVREGNEAVILTFVSEAEGGDWVEGDGHLSSLISVRAELARGDLRGLYLGWLLCAQIGDLDDDELEPAVPLGLGQLSASLEGLVEFLRIDADLVRVAASGSRPAAAPMKARDVSAWLAKLPSAEKDALLARVVAGDAAVGSELAQRMGRENGHRQGSANAAPQRRSVAELLREAERATREGRRIAAERAAEVKAGRERQAAAARARHLDELAGRQANAWRQVDELISTRQPKRYDEAVALLVDLRDLASRTDGSDFWQRLGVLRAQQERKPTLIDRLDKAGL